MSPYLRGIIYGLGSELATALFVWVALLIAGVPLADGVRWFALCFVAPVLIVRTLAHKHTDSRVTKSLLAVLFVTFIAFMYLFLNSQH